MGKRSRLDTADNDDDLIDSCCDRCGSSEHDTADHPG